jgi:hypothetical protein
MAELDPAAPADRGAAAEAAAIQGELEILLQHLLHKVIMVETEIQITLP